MCPQECLQDKCCTNRCRLKPKTKCASGLCCKNCQVRHIFIIITISLFIFGQIVCSSAGGSLGGMLVSQVVSHRCHLWPAGLCGWWLGLCGLWLVVQAVWLRLVAGAVWLVARGSGCAAQAGGWGWQGRLQSCAALQFKRRNSLCRPAADATCDLPEFCSGASASCPPDMYVQDGHDCGQGTGYCYQGRCQSSDLQCKKFYGRGTRLCWLGQGWPQHQDAQFVPAPSGAPVLGGRGAPGEKAQL